MESLESGDFACNDLVTFFTQVVVDDGADASGTIELDYTFGAETTGQPGLGFDDIVSVAINTPDDGNVATSTRQRRDAVERVHRDGGLRPAHGTVTITNLAPARRRSCV